MRPASISAVARRTIRYGDAAAAAADGEEVKVSVHCVRLDWRIEREYSEPESLPRRLGDWEIWNYSAGE